MLVLAGLGISDEKGITLEELEESKSSDHVFIELYTSIWLGNVENLEKIIGKKVRILKRKDLEEESSKILDLATNKKVMIFIPGDPLAATTHSSLIFECIRRGIKFKIIHNSSIFTAICETGLHIYKFGKSVTIPLKDKTRGQIHSVANTIKENRKRGLHTLCLLDIDVENNKFLMVDEAVTFLIENNIIEEEEKIIVASCLGTKKSRIFFSEARDILFRKFELPAVIIIPGDLHFSERDILERL